MQMLLKLNIMSVLHPKMMKMIQLRINLLLKLNHIQTTNLQIEIGNWKAEGLITYSTDQQIFKFNAISGNNQELWGVNADYSSYVQKWTIDAILQHMGFYHTTGNPCVMMRENQKTKSDECIILYQDELYVAPSTLEEIFLFYRTNTKSRSIQMVIYK